MINDEELMKKIEQVTGDFTGHLDDLYAVVGMVVVGRLMGWRVIRLVSSRRLWMLGCKLFGDLKSPDIMPERGVYARKSVGLAIVDKIGGYWDFVRGSINRDELPIHERKLIE
jgi:hypothetical protein